MDLLEKLAAYTARGWRLIPICPNDKKPLIKIEGATCDLETIGKWLCKWPDCNWATRMDWAGLVCVDVDVKHGGMKAWDELSLAHPPLVTLTQRTGSGGRHYLFKAKEGLEYGRKLRHPTTAREIEGIDIKWRGYILLDPSKNQNGPYFWINPFGPILDYPEWLAPLMEKPKRLALEARDFNFSDSFVAKLVEHLCGADMDYHQWVRAGMAIHSAMPDEEGLELFMELTRRSPRYRPEDEESAPKKWSGFKEGDITSGTLVLLANELKITIPNPDAESDKRAFMIASMGKIDATIEMAKDDWLLVDGAYLCSNRELLVKKMNDFGLAVIKNNVGSVFAEISEKGHGQKDVRAHNETTLKYSWAPYFFVQKKVTATGKESLLTTPAYQVWAQHSQRQEYTEIAFDPKGACGPGALNLWSDIPCGESEGDIEGFKWLVEKALCNGNKVMSEWLFDFLAHIFQRPEEKPTVVPVLIGDEGTGKGLLCDGFLGRMLKNFYLRVSTATNVSHRFNKPLAFRLVTFIDEAVWRGDANEDGILKNLIGSDTLSIEEKFGAIYSVNNYSRYFLASNNAQAVAVGRTNRRFVVIESNPEVAGRPELFKSIWNEVRRGPILEAVHHWLLNRDISHFDPFNLPKGNIMGEEAKLATAGVVASFWAEVMEFPVELWQKENILTLSAAYLHFKEFCKEGMWSARNIGQHKFTIETKKLVKQLATRGKVFRSGASTFRGFKITPQEFFSAFCGTLQIAFFEGLKTEDFLIKENDFEN